MCVLNYTTGSCSHTCPAQVMTKENVEKDVPGVSTRLEDNQN